MSPRSLKLKNRKYNRATGNGGEEARRSGIYYAVIQTVNGPYSEPRKKNRYKNSKYVTQRAPGPLSKWI